MERKIPSLVAVPGSKQLVVDGKPFLMRAAELQNSSMTNALFMETIWPKLVDANINTVLGCVSWEQIEPQEGAFDFAGLDRIIKDARQHGLRLVLLWFGSFKNGMSTYCPAWLKTNARRFPRAETYNAEGKIQTREILSIFHKETVNSDANAFRRLMEYIKSVDEGYHTILMVQVENEVGLLGDSRDRSEAAQERFDSAVPSELIQALKDNQDQLNSVLRANIDKFWKHEGAFNVSWESVFGRSKSTDELFMAYHYALYLQQVASAGKAIYPLPMFTNVWMNNGSADDDNAFPAIVGGGGIPGEYPSGGAVPAVLDIWQLFAPALDIIAPDIYLCPYTPTCTNYRHRGQPLFIPEQRRDVYGARRIWVAYGSFQALAASPFGIDTLDPAENPFKSHFGLLKQVSAHVLQAQRKPGSSIGFFFDELAASGADTSPPIEAKFGNWTLKIERAFVFGKPGHGYGMIIHQGGARFLLIGEGFQVKFALDEPGVIFSGILRFEEKEVLDAETGEMRTCRWLNGDETDSGKVAIMPGENPDYGDFPIPITIPARTRIAEVEVYALKE